VNGRVGAMSAFVVHLVHRLDVASKAPMLSGGELTLGTLLFRTIPLLIMNHFHVSGQLPTVNGHVGAMRTFVVHFVYCLDVAGQRLISFAGVLAMGTLLVLHIPLLVMQHCRVSSKLASMTGTGFTK
jgi:hypothetical protein